MLVGSSRESAGLGSVSQVASRSCQARPGASGSTRDVGVLPGAGAGLRGWGLVRVMVSGQAVGVPGRGGGAVAASAQADLSAVSLPVVLSCRQAGGTAGERGAWR
jgi:hypothetical protein